MASDKSGVAPQRAAPGYEYSPWTSRLAPAVQRPARGDDPPRLASPAVRAIVCLAVLIRKNGFEPAATRERERAVSLPPAPRSCPRRSARTTTRRWECRATRTPTPYERATARWRVGPFLSPCGTRSATRRRPQGRAHGSWSTPAAMKVSGRAIRACGRQVCMRI